MNIFLLILGIFGLYLGGEMLVRGSIGLANRLGVSPLIIGLTLVSFATSAPELVVSITAALNGFAGIAIGNVVGSNIVNVLLILGVSLLFCVAPYGGRLIRRNYLFMLTITLIFIILGLDGSLDWPDGLILITLLIYFLFRHWQLSHHGQDDFSGVGQEATVTSVPANRQASVLMLLFLIIIGLIVLFFAAKSTVIGAVAIALYLGVPESIIALTVIAFGTSLPELAATIVAVVRNQSGIAIGNVIGSNIFNILSIIGITSLITRIDMPEGIVIDLWIMTASSAILIPYVFKPRWRADWRSGLIFISLYIFYLLFNVARGGY